MHYEVYAQEVEKPTYIASKATIFEFVSVSYTAESPDIEFSYRTHFADGQILDLSEKITLEDPFWAAKLQGDLKAALLEDLHHVLGISYYKLFCAPAFKTSAVFTEEQASFWNTIYTKGLSEFLYRNAISHTSIAQFSASTHEGQWQRTSHAVAVDPRKILTGIGGGKDSIVSLELLRDFDQKGFIVETGKANHIAHQVCEVAEIPYVRVARTLDPQLVAGIEGSYGGHVPISAVYAFLGILEAALQGSKHVVVSNEYSSNFGNLMHEGNEVNHQWSKSSEFETLFQKYVREYLTPSIRYFSLLRPFYELRIVEMFTQLGKKYFEVFSSCNRNFAHAHEEGASLWCGECPKCAFGFLMLSAFLPKEEVVHIFKKDMFEDAHLLPLYKDILGLGDMKPFDCVGTFDESQAALLLASEKGAIGTVVTSFLPLLTNAQASVAKVMRTYQALSVPSMFRLYGMRSALILGYGREGKATESYLQKYFPELQIGIADKQDGEGYLQKQDSYDIVIKTPVIQKELVTRQYTTATNIFFSLVAPDQIIGITGSKGKSTTSKLMYEMLKRGGQNVRLIGNIGIPALQELLEREAEADELFVFELSSYQLEDLDVSPHVAVITALFPEHIDHHGSLEMYYQAKRNIIRFMETNDVCISAEGFAILDAWADEVAGAALYPEALPFAVTNPSLLGEHNLSNVRIAYTAAKLFGVSEEDAKEAVAEFVGLPHRLEPVGTFKEIAFFDDSISTTPESAIAGIKALGNVDTIILGGIDRGYDFTELEKVLRAHAVRNVILFPESGEHMLQSEDGFTVLHTASMDEAVQFAYAHTQAGKACLLSPAAPSYNLFTNFEERGNAFKASIEKYGTV